ncbi:hypothetical protein BKA65DRAFT_480780 [Rhexocercosporidium sp. MPI-PUGE-AT-0058]|nr:hypothetical protein BKA65DRAFT_480780 [Rhexocercosporidium sp. MPI-PUGE-AT-0058]
MAFAGGGEPAPIPEPNMWKGHPQPDPDVRLLAARYFLADEDPDRCLDFASRIAELEEYVAYLEMGIELQTITCDADLLRDVKVKLVVHRDWEKRRKDGIPDIGCDKKPWQLPSSSRTSATQAPARPNPIQAASGLPTQVREDHPPFSVRREEDHGAFIAALKSDASGDPDEVDIETNLLWTESRAYGWALREPVLIPSWMHPTEGIPRKGVSAADITPWYRKVTAIDHTDTRRTRPARGWIPAYLLAREQKINDLLKKTDLNDKDVEELEDLLHFIEPPELHRLHAETLAFDKDDALGLVTEEEQEYRQKVSDEFAAEQQKWMSGFSDVYFILKTSRPETLKSEQPGVFYICHGVMNPERQSTLAKANELLTQMCSVNGNLDNLSDEDLAAFEVFLQYSQPNAITDLGRRRAAILRQVKANGRDDLEDDDKERYDRIYREEMLERKKWIRTIAGANPEFRYLRPGEMAEIPADPTKPEVLYIPWEISSTPTLQTPILIELALPTAVRTLQENLKLRLANTDDHIDNDDISVGMHQYLEVAYPALRALGTHWMRHRVVPANSSLNFEISKFKQILDQIFERLFRNWRHGLLDQQKILTVKMQRPGQEDERPGILYCRNAISDCNERDRLTIQALLDLGPDRGENDTLHLQTLLTQYQYSALRHLHHEWMSTAHVKPNIPLIERRKKSWVDMMNRWIRTMEGSLIEIKRPNPATDPDNDPSTVYYRGPLRPISYPPMSAEQLSKLKAHLFSNQPIQEYELPGNAPLDIKKAFERFKNSKRPDDGVLYVVQLFSWIESIRDSSLPSTDDDTEIEDDSSDDASVGDEHEACSTSSESTLRNNGSTLGVNLNLLLPQIKDIENEINELAKKSSEERGIRATVRLHELLEQFLPCKMHEEISMIKRQTAQLGRRRKSADVNDLQLRAKRLAREYLAWVRDIGQFGATIRVSTESLIDRRKVLLEFRAHTTGSGTDFRIKGPDGKSHFSAGQLVYHSVPANMPSARGFAEADKLIIRDFERSINSLLSDLSQGTLDWDASESLLSKLRFILPAPLQQQEIEHFAIDKRAREGPQSAEQDMEFWVSWSKWQAALDTWIKAIPNGRVIIATDDPEQDASKTIPLNVSDISELQHLVTPRPKALPHAMKSITQELNVYLFGNFAALSTEERRGIESIFWQFFRPIYRHLRRRLVSHVEKVYFPGGWDSQNLTIEVEALIESIALCCCALYRNILRTLKEVTIDEPTPGEYKLGHAPILAPDDADPMSDTTEYERIATKLLGPFFLEMFTPGRREYLIISAKFRRRITLTPDEQSTFFKAVSRVVETGLSLKQLQIATDIVAKIAAQVFQSQEVADADQTYFLDSEHFCMWYRMTLNTFPEVMRLTESPRVLAGLVKEALLTRYQPPQTISPALVEPPSSAEIQEVQVVLNNLLMQEKTNKATPEMGSAFDFVLTELLSPSLRLLKLRIELQAKGSMDSLSGSMTNGMGFLDAQKGFQSRFQRFKTELYSRFGIVLDSWWYSETVIFAACARWKLWKSTNRNADGTPKFLVSTTSLEHQIQQELFEIYAGLTEWISNGCPKDVSDDTRLRLILNAIPDIGLAPLQAEIRDTTEAMQAAGNMDNPSQAVFLLGIKEEFVKSYMQWYSSQPRSILQALRKQYAGIESSTVDFSGKAERRGIQRAAIQIGLNLLASNQEQHRPADRFRVMDLSRNHVPLEKEIPISLPLEPSRRQSEQDAFEFTKKMLAYKDWKDFDYEVSREKLLEDPSVVIQPKEERFKAFYGEVVNRDLRNPITSYVVLDAPINYNGPFVVAGAADMMETASRRQAELSRIALKLQNAYTEHPRPLLERLLSLVSQGMDAAQLTNHRLYDEVPLTKPELDLLEEISGDSWDEISEDYPESSGALNGFLDANIPLLLAFEADLQKIEGIPLWAPQPGDDVQPTGEFSHPVQIRYSPDIPSKQGVTLDRLSLEFQKLKGITPYVQHDMRQFLEAMKSVGRIHYDGTYGNELVSWIPYSGHPENKYVISKEEALTLPYIRHNALNQLEVQYDVEGRMGPPIVQPNKYEYFQRLAFRLGRDTLRALETLRYPPLSPEQAFYDQTKVAELAEENMKYVTPQERGQIAPSSTANLNDINVMNIALEVCSIAPHLATELGIELPYRNPYITEPVVDVELNTAQAAALIQLKVLEEISNNFEPKFPVEETVWDFADENLATETRTINGRQMLFKRQQTRYFSVRRYPICCQTKATKEAIKKSGPIIQFEPEPEPPLTEQQQLEKERKEEAEAAVEAERGPLKTARHIRGQMPYYPFGETPYQEAYQSHLMEYELRDVEEFNPKPKGVLAGVERGLRRIFGTGETVPAVVVEPPEDPPIPNDPHPLPKIPPGWTPDNISAEEKRLRLIELAKQTPGFPDPAVPEWYHTQEEIEVARIREQTARRLADIAANDAEVERRFGKKKANATAVEWTAWQEACGIVPRTGLKIPARNVTAGGPAATSRPEIGGLQTTGGQGASRPVSRPTSRQGPSGQAAGGRPFTRQGPRPHPLRRNKSLRQGQAASGSSPFASTSRPMNPPSNTPLSGDSPFAPMNLTQPDDGNLATKQLTAEQQAAVGAGLEAMGVMTGPQNEEKKHEEERLENEALRRQVAEFDAAEEEARRQMDAKDADLLLQASAMDDDDVDMDDSECSWEVA